MLSAHVKNVCFSDLQHVPTNILSLSPFITSSLKFLQK